MDPHKQILATVVTVSDEIDAGQDANRSGPLALELLAQHGVHAKLVVVPDDRDQIRSAVAAAIHDGARIVLTCGGTGIGLVSCQVDS